MRGRCEGSMGASYAPCKPLGLLSCSHIGSNWRNLRIHSVRRQRASGVEPTRTGNPVSRCNGIGVVRGRTTYEDRPAMTIRPGR